MLRISSFGTGSGFSRRIDRVVPIISNRPVVCGAGSGAMFSGHRFLSYSVDSAKFESFALRAIGEEARMKKLFVAAL